MYLSELDEFEKAHCPTPSSCPPDRNTEYDSILMKGYMAAGSLALAAAGTTIGVWSLMGGDSGAKLSVSEKGKHVAELTISIRPIPGQAAVLLHGKF